MIRFFIVLLAFCSWCCSRAQKILTTDVLVIGGGTGGTAAGIQSARQGAKTIIVESTPWLGGMISAAGVSAIDGNHRLPSGLWAEFRKDLYNVYGGPQAVETGWVSNTLFEPHVADSLFKDMAKKEKNLSIVYHYSFQSALRKNNKLEAVTFINIQSGEKLLVKAKVYIDATELGDVLKAAGVPYNLGMEADALSDEKVGITQTSDVVQDLTYVAVLKDYGKGADHSIPKPANYDPDEFDASCTNYYKDKSRRAPMVDAKKMLEYGKLPHNKYMINWPLYGNDTYLNVVEMNDAQREKELVKAKETTRRFVYFIQHELGFKNLGYADDEFKTADSLALIPYYREGRRVKGMVRFTMRHIAEPFTYGEPLYRTGISVGDYPIDHHHKKNLSAPQHLEFYPIPSFNVPLGALIPQIIDNLVVAEKGISVSNVANGTTRLEPCVLLTGQAAGLLAAMSVLQYKAPKNISVRAVQENLLKAGAYIMPYIDVTPENPFFTAIQKIGATGILRGKGIPFKWANQTWFYPDSLVHAATFLKDVAEFEELSFTPSTVFIRIADAISIIAQLQKKLQQGKKNSVANTLTSEMAKNAWDRWGLKNFEENRFIKRGEMAVLLTKTIDPFASRQINHNGKFLHTH